MAAARAQPAYLEFGLLMMLVPLLSPQGWDYVLLLATPAAVCLVDRFREMPRPWRIVTAVAFAFMSFTIFDLLGRTLYARHDGAVGRQRRGDRSRGMPDRWSAVARSRRNRRPT